MEFLKMYADEEKLKETLMYGPSLMKYSSKATTGLKDKGDIKSNLRNEKGYIGQGPVKKGQLYDALLAYLPQGTNMEDVNIVEMTGTPRSAVFGGSVKGVCTANSKTYDFALYFLDYEDNGNGVQFAKRYTLDTGLSGVTEKV